MKVGFSLFLFLAVSYFIPGNRNFERRERLSEYNFFKGKLSDLDPADGVIPYDVNTALFSNYAEKSRFVKIPAGTMATYNDSASFEFPEGTILIKNFYYPLDARNASKGKNIVETRLLVRETQGWQAYPYIWNEEQTDAVYDPAGETRTITYVNSRGRKTTTPYVIPNKNQCKGCHSVNNEMKPIGTTARQLNRPVKSGSSSENQLSHWRDLSILNELPSNVPKLAVWNDPATGSLNDRARAYLDANCGHCHSRPGPGNTSGLFLDIYETDPGKLGVHKSPVAAGRATTNLRYDIEPGQPNNSILVFRMKTNDPGIAMPEIGRERVHDEGVALIEEWIRKNNF